MDCFLSPEKAVSLPLASLLFEYFKNSQTMPLKYTEFLVAALEMKMPGIYDFIESRLSST